MHLGAPSLGRVQSVELTDMQDVSKKISKPQNTSVSSATKGTPAVPKPQPAKKETGPKRVASEVKRRQPIKYAGLESARNPSNGTAGATTREPRDDDSDSRSSKKVAVEGTTGALAANKAPPSLGWPHAACPSLALAPKSLILNPHVYEQSPTTNEPHEMTVQVVVNRLLSSSAVSQRIKFQFGQTYDRSPL
ncbi:hypothetical protein DL768_004227 [Monosporascus sp. mg162]|nr:hypothetical protein DL768_004227 [Monosporascus sp. mg162]